MGSGFGAWYLSMVADTHTGPRAYGSDPGADALPLAALAQMRFNESDPDFAAFRRAALNTVDHLESELETVIAQRNTLSSKLTYRLDARGMARGAVSLLVELRKAVGEADEAGRRWLAGQVAAVLTGPTEPTGVLTSRIADRVEELAEGRPGLREATLRASTWAETTVSDPFTNRGAGAA